MSQMEVNMNYSLGKPIGKVFYILRLLLLISVLISAPGTAESVFVKYRGEAIPVVQAVMYGL